MSRINVPDLSHLSHVRRALLVGIDTAIEQANENMADNIYTCNVIRSVLRDLHIGETGYRAASAFSELVDTTLADQIITLRPDIDPDIAIKSLGNCGMVGLVALLEGGHFVMNLFSCDVPMQTLNEYRLEWLEAMKRHVEQL